MKIQLNIIIKAQSRIASSWRCSSFAITQTCSGIVILGSFAVTQICSGVIILGSFAVTQPPSKSSFPSSRLCLNTSLWILHLWHLHIHSCTVPSYYYPAEEVATPKAFQKADHCEEKHCIDILQFASTRKWKKNIDIQKSRSFNIF